MDPINHDPADLTAHGYEFADMEFPDMPSFPIMRRIAKRLDYPVSAITSFRHAAHSWGVWIAPGASKGFAETPALLSK